MSSFDLIKGRKLSVEAVHAKYQAGQNTDVFAEIKQLAPVFSFDFVSVRGSDFCFDGKSLGRNDYVKLMKALKEISTYTYATLNGEYRFHFHEVDWNNVTISEADFYKCIYEKAAKERNITVYQCKVFEEARIIGFIYKGVFYLVLFDRLHRAYDRDRPKAMKNRGKRKRK